MNWDIKNERDDLSMLVALFGEAMRQKLRQKFEQGYRYWNDTTYSHMVEDLQDKLHSHVERYKKGDPKQLVDIANLAAMLWFHEVFLKMSKTS